MVGLELRKNGNGKRKNEEKCRKRGIDKEGKKKRSGREIGKRLKKEYRKKGIED